MPENTSPLLDGVTPLSEPTPQLAQLELRFKGPLLTDEMVENLEDLANGTLNPKYNYQHKHVWVKERKCYYYLDNGNGENLSNWRKEIARAVIEQWYIDEAYIESGKNQYQEGDTVHLNGKIYSALKDVPAGIDPSINEEYWQCICGETETVRYIFKEASSIILYTEIRNPKFQVIIGDFVLDGDNYVLDPETGLVMLENQEIIDCHVRERIDLTHPEGGGTDPSDPNNINHGGIPDGGIRGGDGCAYELRFIEKSQPIKLTGVVNIK